MIGKRSTISNAILLLLAFTIYSATAIFSKLASQYEVLSIPYLLYLSCVILSLGIYAILWQGILSFMPLNKAFLCKSTTIIIILCISHFLFNEEITAKNLIGAGFIVCGLVTLSWTK